MGDDLHRTVVIVDQRRERFFGDVDHSGGLGAEHVAARNYLQRENTIDPREDQQLESRIYLHCIASERTNGREASVQRSISSVAVR